jgi:Pyruvate/2-oxoacid:ferredoxin oxidoreductase gamma subunit
MHITIGFSGAAGTGVNTAGLFLSEILAEKGYTLRADKEYASIIKGDNNNFFLSISSENEMQLSKTIDLFFAFDDFAITKNQEIYQLENVIPLKDVQAKYRNTFAFGACLEIVNIPLSEGEDFLKQHAKGESLEDNLADLQAGYSYGKQHFAYLCQTVNLSEKIGEAKKLMFGNQLLAEGAIQA